jgi:hypothetical protein
MQTATGTIAPGVVGNPRSAAHREPTQSAPSISFGLNRSRRASGDTAATRTGRTPTIRAMGNSGEV